MKTQNKRSEILWAESFQSNGWLDQCSLRSTTSLQIAVELRLRQDTNIGPPVFSAIY